MNSFSHINYIVKNENIISIFEQQSTLMQTKSIPYYFVFIYKLKKIAKISFVTNYINILLSTIIGYNNNMDSL